VPENYEKLMSLEKKTGKTLTKIPALYAAGKLFGGNDEILRNLDALFKGYMEIRAAGVDVPIEPGIKAIAAKQLQLLPILFAGVVDSINPCAFATIVFFLSYMSLVLKKSRSEVFFAGLVFIAGVFITYFFIGVGIFKAVLGLTGILKYSKYLYLVIGIFVLFLSGRHFYEASVLKRTGLLDDEEVKMKLPDWIRKTIEKLITRFTGMKFILPFVFMLAVLITLFQLACTVQVYLPSIIYLTSIPEYRTSAYLFLLLYCFLFVLPLILIFVMYYFGLTTLALKRFFKNKIVTMKLAMAVFFLIMAVFMISEGIK
jgi:cytochrome c biogenesis protein CcdA